MTTSLADFTVPAASKQYLKVNVTATVNGSSINPGADTVQFACIAPGKAPVSADWVAGSWETISSLYYARVLLGPGTSLILAKGLYAVFVKITDNPEVPVLKAGLLEITP